MFRIFSTAIILLIFSGNLYAADFFSILDVRYESGLKKTFLAGPFKGNDWCEKMNQSIWDNVQPVCDNCKKEISLCTESAKLNEPFRKVINGEPSPFVYLITNKKNRIMFSGSTKAIVEAECENSALKFRSNGYPDAKCIR